MIVRRVGGDPEFRRRLLELGVVPGVRVKMIRAAPMGDPLEVEIRGADFTLRKAEAARIRGKLLVEHEEEHSSVEREEFKISPVPNAPASRSYNVAIAGIPNSGKTTLFNALTGGRGKVGNYPGITVDRLTGDIRLPQDIQAHLVDIPGTYSLTARSAEEQVAIDELLGRPGRAAPDLVVVVLNPTTMEWNGPSGRLSTRIHNSPGVYWFIVCLPGRATTGFRLTHSDFISFSQQFHSKTLRKSPWN